MKKIDNEYARVSSDAIAEEAFYWATRLEDDGCSLADHGEFVHWLKESPAHIREFFCIIATWEGLNKIENLSQDSIDKLLDGINESENVVPFLATTQVVENQTTAIRSLRKFCSGRWKSVIAVAGLIASGVLSLLFYADESDVSAYSTYLGEQRSLILDDGSMLYLNTLSSIKIRFSTERRWVELISGEALFQVAHDTKRPFFVQTDNTLVRAVGTAFNVYHNSYQGNATVVTVVEGKVAISSKSSFHAKDGQEEYTLSVGDQLTIKPSGEFIRKAVSSDGVKDATAWRQRKLVFDSIPLIEVASEFNRYNRQKIVVQSKAIGERKISGVFNANTPADLLKFLEYDRSVKVAKISGEIVISENFAELGSF